MQLVKFKRYRTTETFESAEDVIVNADKVAYLMPGAQADATIIVLDGDSEVVVFGQPTSVAQCLVGYPPDAHVRYDGTSPQLVGYKRPATVDDVVAALNENDGGRVWAVTE